MDTEEENKYKNDEDTGLKVTFLCVIFINDSIVTGSDDGYVKNYR